MEAVASIQSWEVAQAGRLAPVLERRLGKGMREILSAYEGEEGGCRLIRAARDLDPRDTADILEELKAHRVPAVLLWGDRDPFFPVDKVARPLANLLGAELQIFAAGHFLPLDVPEPVSAALCAFLAKTVFAEVFTKRILSVSVF